MKTKLFLGSILENGQIKWRLVTYLGRHDADWRCWGRLEVQQQRSVGEVRVTACPGFEQLSGDDLLTSVQVLAQVAEFLRLPVTGHYQQAPPLQEPGGEKGQIWELLI